MSEVSARRTRAVLHQRVKEVWFVGCHSDVYVEEHASLLLVLIRRIDRGGGNKRNERLLMDEIPASWMANEAQDEGLTFNDSNVDWEMSKIQEQKPRESLRWWWWLAEAIPFLRRQEDCPKPHQWFVAVSITFTRADSRSRIIPHMGAHRIIYPGQKIHLSVALNRKYLPKAQFHAYSSTAHSPAWSTILGKDLDANEGDTQDASKYGWMDDLGDILELDLFDITAIPELVKKLSQPQDSKVALDHLFVLAHDGAYRCPSHT